MQGSRKSERRIKVGVAVCGAEVIYTLCENVCCCCNYKKIYYCSTGAKITRASTVLVPHQTAQVLKNFVAGLASLIKKYKNWKEAYADGAQRMKAFRSSGTKQTGLRLRCKRHKPRRGH